MNLAGWLDGLSDSVAHYGQPNEALINEVEGMEGLFWQDMSTLTSLGLLP